MWKLPIWGTVKHSFGFCFSRFGAMMKLATVPLALYVFIMAVGFALVPDAFIEEMMGASSVNPVSSVTNILTAIAIIPFATAWHRQYLSHEEAPLGWISYAFGKKETRYLLFSFLLMLIIVVIAVVPSFIGGVVGILVVGDGISFGELMSVFAIVLFCFFVVVRTAMVFPAAAVGASAGFKDSWRATKGSFWRMAFIYMLLGFLLTIPLAVITMIIGLMLGGAIVSGDTSAITMASTISATILVPFQMIASAISVSCLSIIYKFLSEKDNVGQDISGSVEQGT